MYHAPFREDWETTPHVEEGTTAGISFHAFTIDTAHKPVEHKGADIAIY
jgi:hypothetical protein